MSKNILYTVLLFHVFFNVCSQQESRNNRGYANHLIIPGSYIQAHDDKYLNGGTWINGFTNDKNIATIELGLDEDKHLPHTSSFKICAKFDLELTDANHSSTVIPAQQLDINYNPADLSVYRDKAQIIFPNIYKVKISNVNITTCSLTTGCSSCTTTYTLGDVYLQAEISTLRIYSFTTTNTFSTGDLTHTLTATDELEIAWPFLAGATEYELEYTFIDDYSTTTGSYVASSTLPYDLDHDATRIVTNNNHYSIPLTYEHGYIVYRLRPIGTYTTLDRAEGTWYPSVPSGSINTAQCVAAITPTFPSQALNWQSTKTFAEHGKTGVAVNFSDALGLPRQNLARLNTEAKVLVQNSLFDFFGRPTVDFLPSPVTGLDFNYRFGINVYTTSTVFDKLIFERSNTNNFCSPSSFSLSPSLSKGAANYYSPQNINQEKYQGYLPDAQGFPFVQIKYTNDGLNRTAKQTLPGMLHQLGSGKEIKHTYVKPEQVQIDRLFGSEAGRSNYYSRNSTTDPNGQVSLEFLDIYGRTVASCLKGIKPTNLDALPNYTTSSILKESYGEQPTNQPDSIMRCKEVNTEIEIFSAGEQEPFVYQATWGTAFTSNCDPNLCFHCVYDVTLSITGECGNEIFDYDNNISTAPGYTGSIGRLAPYTSTISCSQPTSAYVTSTSLSNSVSITFPTPGKYKIYKRICVSDAPLADYTKTYLKTNCGIDKCQIYNNILNSIDFKGCLPMDCQTCYSLATAYSNSAAASPTNNFTYTGPLNGGVYMDSGGGTNGSTGVVYTPTMTPQKVSEALENCAIYCSQSDRCSTYEKLMEADFYPGAGQFAATSSLSPNWSMSIFNPTNTLPGTPLWSTSTNSYSNAAGQADFVLINGVNKPPQSLTVSEFTQYFRKSWAKTLMTHHPEYCKKYFYCNMLASTLDYDDELRKTYHFDKACSVGYVFPIPYGSYSVYQPTNSCSTSSADPISALSYTSNAAFATAISNFTYEVTHNFRNTTGYDIYKFVATQTHSAIASGTVTSIDYMGKDACSADEDWNSFKTYYLIAKQILYDKLLSAFTASPSSYGYTLSTGCAPLSTLAVSHFPDPLGDLDAEFPVTGTNTPASSLYTTAINPPSSGSGTAAIASYTNSMNQFSITAVPSQSAIASQCSLSCNSYTSVWNINLTAACPAYSNTTNTVKNNILNAMVEVCKLGCDYNTNLLGASSTSPGLNYMLPSTSFTVNNFQQILDYYLGSGVCNSVIINAPKPYPANNGTVTLNGLTSCKCDIVLQVSSDFAAGHPGINYEWEMFEQKYGFDLPEYNRLKCACQAATNNTWTAGHLWTTTQLNALKNYTLPVNPQLICNSCLSCTEVVTAINSLTITLPISNTYTYIPDKINHSPGNQIYVLNTLNSMFGLHTLQDYMDLYHDCESFTSTSTITAYTFSNTITKQGADLFFYLNSIIGNPTFVNTHTMTLCTDDKFYISSLYGGSLPTIPGYTYTPTINSNSLTIAITQSAVTIASILLVKPSSYTGGWNNFNQLNDFVAYFPPPLVGGPNYGFKVTATDNNFTTVVLTGSVTSGNWPIGYLSSGTSTVPSICPAPPLPEKNACAINLINSAFTQAQHQYQKNLAAMTATFQTAWKDYCFYTLNETFTRTYNGGDEYGHTLYYYDQAGNLQRTVPPLGSDPNILTTVTVALAAGTNSLPAYSSSLGVNLRYVSDYHYNSYNLLTQENTIDGGLTNYYYDEFGRIMATQNAQQRAISIPTVNVYSYTLYDPMGRITESGVTSLTSTTAIGQDNYATFQTAITSVSTRSQVTTVYYDRASSTSSVLAAFTGSVQRNLRNRVAFVSYMENYSSTVTNYDHATYYSYDDHGNVSELVQHNKQLDVFNQGFRNVKYEYELVSGNMLKATYQNQKPDQFIHKYYYDADNRLSEVFTSKDNVNWDRDAKYFYYEHGPLARIERGDKKVQGTDYFYTIHGWIKGINSDALSQTSDAGKDGTTGNKYLSSYNNVHEWFAKDAMAYSLNYYNTATVADYKAIKSFTSGDLTPLMPLSNLTNTANPFYLDDNSSVLSGDGADLFNGNISSMTTSFIDKDPANSISNNSPFPLLTGYRYDQLHRITKMKSFRSYSASTLTWNPGNSTNYDDAYKMNFSYDNNGNILTLLRKGPGTGIVSGSSLNMDDLQYTYFNIASGAPNSMTINVNSNKLMCVNDQVSSSNYNTDLDDYTCYDRTTRYSYDAIGNMIQDNAEFISDITWTVDRKVKNIIRNAGAMLTAGITKPDIEYEYNPQRQRVVKIVKPRDPSTRELRPISEWIYTYYVYDASGNVMATYNRTASQISGSTYKDQLSLIENPVLGSERLALARPSNTFATWTYTFNNSCGSPDNCRFLPTAGPTSNYTLAASGYTTGRSLGYKDFELNNHLGNVISTVSDRKIQSNYSPGTCLKVYDFQSGVPASSDINPNNMTLSTSGGSLVCTMQTVSYISGINPQFGNNLTAGLVYQFEFDFDPGSLTISDGLYIVPFDYNGSSLTTGAYFWNTGTVPPAGHYTYTYTPSHTGSTYTTQLAFNTGSGTHFFKVDNIKLCPAVGAVASYSPDIVSNTDYYPFGQEMPGRSWTGGDRYRYGFNGKENDKELSSGAQDYGFRMNDTRIGRFFSVDPLRYEFPWYSPYQFAGNSPILNIDLDGLEDISINKLPDKSIAIQVVYTKDDVKELLKPNNEGKVEKRIKYQENGVTVKEPTQFEGPTKAAEQKVSERLSKRLEGAIRNKDLLKGNEYEYSADETIPAPASESSPTKTEPKSKINPTPKVEPTTKTIKYAVFDIQVERKNFETLQSLDNDYLKSYIREAGLQYKQMLGVDQVIFGKIILMDNLPLKDINSYDRTIDGHIYADPEVINQGTKEVPINTPTTDQLP